MRSVLFVVVAPKWRAWLRPTPELGRPWLRWEVVRETRPHVRDDGIIISGWEHVSYHWTWRAASRAQRMNQAVRRVVYGDGAP